MTRIVPIHELKRRVQEQGRIRCGKKSAAGHPQKLNRFRLTSQDREALEVIARLYGGDVEPWPDGPTAGQHQVTVTEAKIPIVLPPDPLDGTPIYELWSGGGCIRRCDGLRATLQRAKGASPDAEPAVVDCPCRVQHRMDCKPKTRLNVILKEVPFAGTWRLESNGWNAAEELPGMVDMCLRVQERGLTVAYLEIRERQAEQGAKKFVVPAVGLPESIEALAAGEMKLVALGRVQEIGESALHHAPALNAPAVEGPDWFEDEGDDGSTTGDRSGADQRAGDAVDAADDRDLHAPLVDDDIADAELVDDPPPARTRKVMSPRLKALHAAITDAVELDEIKEDVPGAKKAERVDALRHALVALVTKGRTESSNELNDAEQHQALELVADLLAGARRYIGVHDGRLRLSARRAEAS